MVSDVVDQSGFEVLLRMLAALFIYLLFFCCFLFPFEILLLLLFSKIRKSAASESCLSVMGQTVLLVTCPVLH